MISTEKISYLMAFFVLIYSIYITFLYVGQMPIVKLSKLSKKKIQEHGLIHFTTQESAERIIQEGLKGKVCHMGFPENKFGELIWTYEYPGIDGIDEKRKVLLHTKRGKELNQFSVCLHITGLNPKDIDKMRTRFGITRDRPIIYRGKYLHANKIEIVKTWRNGYNM